MRKHSSPTLAEAAGHISPSEMCLAPELPTLAALDALLLATTRLLEFQTPALGWKDAKPTREGPSPDEQIAEAIHFLANALRKNLAAYYAVIRDNCQETNPPGQILF